MAEKAEIARLRVKGLGMQKIGEKIGRSRLTVRKALRTDEIRGIIEREASRIIEKGLHPAGDLIVGLVKEGLEKDAGQDVKRLGLDAAKHITGMAGLSGGAPGTVINTMIQVNQNPDRVSELSNVQRFLAHQWGVKEEEVQDAEVEDDDRGK